MRTDWTPVSSIQPSVIHPTNNPTHRAAGPGLGGALQGVPGLGRKVAHSRRLSFVVHGGVDVLRDHAHKVLGEQQVEGGAAGRQQGRWM